MRMIWPPRVRMKMIFFFIRSVTQFHLLFSASVLVGLKTKRIQEAETEEKKLVFLVFLFPYRNCFFFILLFYFSAGLILHIIIHDICVCAAFHIAMNVGVCIQMNRCTKWISAENWRIFAKNEKSQPNSKQIKNNYNGR